MQHLEPCLVAAEGVEQRNYARLVQGEDQRRAAEQAQKPAAPRDRGDQHGAGHQEHDLDALAAVQDVDATAGCAQPRAHGLHRDARVKGADERSRSTHSSLVDHHPFDPASLGLRIQTLQHREQRQEDHGARQRPAELDPILGCDGGRGRRQA